MITEDLLFSQGDNLLAFMQDFRKAYQVNSKLVIIFLYIDD